MAGYLPLLILQLVLQCGVLAQGWSTAYVMQMWVALPSNNEHSCSIPHRCQAQPTLLLKKRAVPSINHNASFLTSWTSRRTYILHYCYYYYRHFIFMLWRIYCLNRLLITPTLNLSDRDSQFRIKVTFVIFGLQTKFLNKIGVCVYIYTYLFIYLFIIYNNIKFHIPEVSC